MVSVEKDSRPEFTLRTTTSQRILNKTPSGASLRTCADLSIKNAVQ